MAGELGDIGTAHITVELDFRNAVEETKTAGKNLPPVEVEVSVDKSKASREVRDALTAASATAGPIHADVEVDKAKIARDAESGYEQWEDVFKNPITLRTKIDAKAIQKKFRDALTPPPIDGTSSGSKFGDGFGHGFISSISKLDLGGKIFSVLKPAAFTAAIGLVAQAASVGITAIAGLTGSLGSLQGALVATPFALGLVQQSMFVVKLGLQGVDDALGGLTDEINKEAFDKLTKPAQAFVVALDKLKPKVIAFQKSLQTRLLPKFTEALGIAVPALEKLQGPLQRTADRIGELSVSASKGFSKQSGSIALLIRFNNSLIKSLGKTGGKLTDSLIKVLLEARPLVAFMVDGLNDLATALNESINKGVKSGGIAKFFEQTRFSLTQIIKLVGSVGSILGSVFGAATPTGNRLLVMLNEQAAALSDFLNTTDGKDSLKKFFADSFPSIIEVGRLIRDVTLAFFELSRTKGLRKVLTTIREDLLPAITSLLTVTTNRLLPELVPALSEIVQLFANIGGTSSLIQDLFRAIGSLAGSANKLFKENPGLAEFVANVIVLNTILGIGKLASKLFVLGDALKWVAGALASLGGGVSFAGVISVITGPVGLIAGAVTAIYAFGAAVLYAYKQSKLFRTVFDTLDSLTSFIPGLNSVRGAASLFAAAFDDSRSAGERFKLFLQGLFNILPQFIPIRLAINLISTAFDLAGVSAKKFFDFLGTAAETALKLTPIGFAMDALGIKIGDVQDKAVSLFNTITLGAVPAGLNLVGSAADMVSTKLDSTGLKAQQLVPKINASFGSIASATTQLTSTAATRQTTFSGLFATAERLIGGAVRGARKHALALAKAAGNVLRSVGDAIRQHLAKQAIDNARDAIVGLSASFRRFVPNAVAFNANAQHVRINVVLLRVQITLLGTAFLTLVRNMVAAANFASTRLVNVFTASITRIRAVLAGANLFGSGRRMMLTLLAGLRSGYSEVQHFIRGIADWIRKNKGPISADKQLLFPAGQAIMGGFDKGLRKRWSPVKEWVSDIGMYFKGAVSPNLFNSAISSILLGGGNGVKGLNNILGGALGIDPALLANGPMGFLHPSSGWGDTLSQGRLISRMFNLVMGSGLRNYDTVPGPGVSQHTTGHAIDWPIIPNGFAKLDRFARFASKLQNVFKQVIWLNRDLIGGFFVGDHMDHVHTGWQERAAGGGVKPGQAYSWNERGREMFIPQQSGYVMNAGRTKELISAIKSLSSKPQQSSSNNPVINVHSNATDPVAIGSIVMSNLGSVFSRA